MQWMNRSEFARVSTALISHFMHHFQCSVARMAQIPTP